MFDRSEKAPKNRFVFHSFRCHDDFLQTASPYDSLAYSQSMRLLNNAFDFYQTISNVSVTNETVSESRLTSHDIVLFVSLSLACLLLALCAIKTVVRRCRKSPERRAKRTAKSRVLNRSDIEKNPAETPSQSIVSQ